jgi:hypothetical protein
MGDSMQTRASGGWSLRVPSAVAAIRCRTNGHRYVRDVPKPNLDRPTSALAAPARMRSSTGPVIAPMRSPWWLRQRVGVRGRS